MKSDSVSRPITPDATQRIDSWLWASRFFRTRRLAHDAVSGGHVWLNGQRCKPARAVKPGDRLRIRRQETEYIVVIAGLSGNRLGAPLAMKLYHETADSRERREHEAAQRQFQRRSITYDSHRPSKRDREKTRSFKQQYLESDG